MGYYSSYGSINSTHYPTSNSSDIFTVLNKTLGGFFVLFLIIAISLIVLQIISNWKIFTKAGEKGWKSIIPFYNIAILYKISNMSPWLILVYIGVLIPILNIFSYIAIYVITLYQKINLAKGFNKDTGFTVGMIILPTIYSLILGLGDSKYIGFSKNTSTENGKIENN